MNSTFLEAMSRQSGGGSSSFFFQPQLLTGAQNDTLEAEANQVADSVMHGAGRAAGGAISTVGPRGMLSRKEQVAQPPFFSGAQPLPPAEKHFFESGLNKDLSGVRIH